MLLLRVSPTYTELIADNFTHFTHQCFIHRCFYVSHILLYILRVGRTEQRRSNARIATTLFSTASFSIG